MAPKNPQGDIEELWHIPSSNGENAVAFRAQPSKCALFQVIVG